MTVGDYVRTKNGRIGKIINFIDEPTDYYFNCYETNLPKNWEDKYITEYDNNIKSSPNILELLEPMDLLYIDIDGGFEGGIVVPRMAETQDELNGFVEFIKSGHWILKGVVTHEQLINDMYEVGEQNGIMERYT